MLGPGSKARHRTRSGSSRELPGAGAAGPCQSRPSQRAAAGRGSQPGPGTPHQPRAKATHQRSARPPEPPSLPPFLLLPPSHGPLASQLRASRGTDVRLTPRSPQPRCYYSPPGGKSAGVLHGGQPLPVGTPVGSMGVTPRAAGTALEPFCSLLSPFQQPPPECSAPRAAPWAGGPLPSPWLEAPAPLRERLLLHPRVQRSRRKPWQLGSIGCSAPHGAMEGCGWSLQHFPIDSANATANVVLCVSQAGRAVCTNN